MCWHVYIFTQDIGQSEHITYTVINKVIKVFCVLKNTLNLIVEPLIYVLSSLVEMLRFVPLSYIFIKIYFFIFILNLQPTKSMINNLSSVTLSFHWRMNHILFPSDRMFTNSLSFSYSLLHIIHMKLWCTLYLSI